MSDENNGVFGSISKYAVSTVADKEAYTDLRDVAVEALKTFPRFDDAAETFRTECEAGETEFMEINYGSDPDAKHVSGKRNGQWKFRSYLPNSYSSSKTELVKGLEAGIDPAGLGKSDLNKQRTETTKAERTVEEKIADYVGKLNRAINSIDDANQRQAQRQQAIRSLSTS